MSLHTKKPIYKKRSMNKIDLEKMSPETRGKIKEYEICTYQGGEDETSHAAT